MIRTMAAGFVALLAAAAAVTAFGQPAHIYGIHDDTPSIPTDWINNCPGQTAWITATEAIGHNPADTGGKAYSPPAGSKIIARLNNGYFPDGTIPLKSEYANFAQRCANFVAASTNCDTWIIGNELNLGVEWPNDGAGNLVYVSPADYADCFKRCYNAIKAVRPAHKVLVQATGPWGGPYGPGSMGGYNVPGQPDNWPDFLYKVLVAITTGTGAVTPDGIAMHINTRGWNPATVFNPGPFVRAAGLNLDFSWGVMRDWIQFGMPRNLWNLPLYATESNGLYYWKGGGPESPSDPAYSSGWLQKIYDEVGTWNQNAGNFGMPIYRCVNMYRWSNFDNWSIDAAPQRSTILADLAGAAAANHTWPPFGGNTVSIGSPGSLPPGVKLTAGIAATADSEFDSNNAAAKAFDGSQATKWNSTNAAQTHWLVADLVSEQTITGYVVRHAGSGGEAAYFNTAGFRIETSSAGSSGPWRIHTLVRTNTPGVNPPASTTLSYATPVTARYIRLFVNAPCLVDDYARIPEFEIYVEGAGVAEWSMY